MTTFIIIIVLFIIGKFLYDKSQVDIKVGKEGGMRQKYKTLISHLLSADSNAKIIKESKDTIVIGNASAGGITNFGLIQTFNELTVQWRMESPIFGSHKLDWVFPEYGDQDKMIEKILNDLGKYQKNVIQSSPFRGLAMDDDD